MKQNILKRILIFLLLWSLSFSLVLSYGFDTPSGNFDYNRARLLSHMLHQYLISHHYSHKKIDNALSRDAFDLYLKEIDPQKRLLLKSDVEKLRVAYSDKIDDEMNTSAIKLPEAMSKILDGRISKIRDMVKDMLSKDFDFSSHEYLETDVEKLDYCKTEEQLKERWRKTLKFQVLTRYLNLAEDETAQSKTSDQGAAREKILKGYEETFSRMLKEKASERFDGYFEAVTRAFDPHTTYMPPMDKEDFDIGMKGSLEGIGATLKEDEGFIKVVDVIPGSPASRQGQLHSEDIIMKVAEGKAEPVDITDMKVKDAVKLIRGKKGTEVRLTVKKQDGVRVVVPIVRDVIQIDETFAKSTLLREEKSGSGYGYIKLPTFYRDFDGAGHGGNGRNSTDDVKAEVKKLEAENIKGLILDLRNNGGGALTDAVGIAGLFIKSGPIVQVKGGDGRIKVLSDEDAGISYEGPLVVLVNRFSASASEILAGALQDYGRAVIIGSDHTHGKGTVQTMIDLDDSIPFRNMDKFKPLGALKVTIQKFYRVSGGSTQYKGVESDIALPDRMKCIKTGEQYLDHALPWDTVPPASYAKWPRPMPDISSLREKSVSRVRSNQDFISLEAKSKRICEQQEKKLQSLNIDDVRKEQEEAKKFKDMKDIHGSMDAAFKKPDGAQTTEKDRRELWIKEVRGDAYIKEAASVLTDMIGGPSK